MRILLTNHALSERSGTEVYLRDVALALLARGHEPIAYSRRLGDVARELRRATVPVLDDLAALERPPDVIHAQHHLEAMTALARYPQTPALFVCHGWLPAEEAPPRHPRILRYLAVDELVRRRLVEECGIDEERVDIHLNFVDLDRFRPRDEPLPPRPGRALVFSNHVSDDNHLPVLRAACDRLGIELDTVGRAQRRETDRPEDLLGRYDVVFGKGRAAIESAAVGAAVVLCDVAGLGPLVTSGDLDRLRSLNFGVRLLRDPVTIDRVVERLERYDADDAAAVSRRMRRAAGMQPSVDRLVEAYEAVLADARGRSFPLEDDSRAVARYLRRGPLTGGDFHREERETLLSDVARERERVAVLRQTLEAVRTDNARLAAEATELQRAVAAEHAEKVAMANDLEAERSRFEAERRLARHLEALKAARVDLQQGKDLAERELGAAREALAREEAERAAAEAARDELDAARDELDAARARAEAARSAAEAARVESHAARAAAEEALERTRRDLDGRLRQVEARERSAAAELQRVVGSATWRARRIVLALPGLRSLYRWLRRSA